MMSIPDWTWLWPIEARRQDSWGCPNSSYLFIGRDCNHFNARAHLCSAQNMFPPPTQYFAGAPSNQSWLAPPDFVISWKKYKQATVFPPPTIVRAGAARLKPWHSDLVPRTICTQAVFLHDNLESTLTVIFGQSDFPPLFKSEHFCLRLPDTIRLWAAVIYTGSEWLLRAVGDSATA